MPHSDDLPHQPAGELRRIARYRRWLIAVTIAQLVLWPGFYALAAIRGEVVFESLRVQVVLTFVLGGVGGIMTFLLYWTLRRPFAAVVMGLACLPPCLGLLVFLVANTTATAALRTHGIEVGLLGARDSDIP